MPPQCNGRALFGVGGAGVSRRKPSRWGGRARFSVGGTGVGRQTPASDGMPARSTSPTHWTLQPSSCAQSDRRGSSQPTAYGGGDFTFGLDSPDIVGAKLGGGKLSFSIGDALSFAPHDGIIFSLLPTL